MSLSSSSNLILNGILTRMIHGPAGEQIHDFREQISAKHDFVVQKKGVYRFCFTNKSPYHETIDFDVQLGHFAYYDQHAKDEHFTPLMEQISKLEEALYNIQFEQHWLEAQTDRQAIVNENMSKRAVHKALFESFALIGASVLQVYLLRRLFERKLGMSRTRKKSVEEVVDKDYMSYLTWLVDSFEHPTTVVPEKDLSAKVKVEIDSWCSDDDDDDDIIEVSDTPFTDGESTPFVVSKNKEVIDLEKDDSTDDDESGSSSVFRRELIDVLEKPYDAGELLLLSSQASMKKPVSRCRELRKGRESSYETSELGLSYLEKVCDFDREYKLADGDDKARLELLRGFFFYLENISLSGAFKPWLPENMKKLGQRKQCLQP
ncbi:hypothetical protein F2Q68_00018104 [Brassica cretica]|uniref:GOLD domain-containing protein n=1 Tax=Brassica cretica TaxID=69181 RepID=A0A8S9HTI0_BRACR|nr:hypothetical protein F2Q68_00018104 [Brassica cretica]